MSPPQWRTVLRNNFTKWQELVDYLKLNEEDRHALLQRSSFPLNLPQRLAEKIEKGTLDDPILRQFVPLREEELHNADFSCDPVGDLAARQTPRLLHKYHGRALLMPTSACAMHCRYCFRRHFDYATSTPTFVDEMAAIRQDTTLSEIILSGGDPLSLSDAQLSDLLAQLDAIPHVERIRVHTRFPIGIPERITPTLLSTLEQLRAQVIIVIHCNHPKELDDEVSFVLKQIQQLSIPVLNQAVLLAGVNDTVETLEALCKRLVASGVLPYYLHQLDRVLGAAHFEVPEAKGRELIAALITRLPGYAIPRYVREIAGETAKTPLLQTV